MRRPVSADRPASGFEYGFAPGGPAVESLEGRTLLSLAVELDYSFDTNGFFDEPDRRAVVEFAAEYLGGLIQDSLLAIIPGAGNSWSARFLHPGTGAMAEVHNPTVPADTIRIYVGGRDLGGTQLGLGGAGGWSASGSTSFLQIVEGRGQPGATGPEASRTDFAPWGGSVAFDLDANWHTEVSAAGLGSGETDLLSLALHEFAHVLGFADSTPSFENLISGSAFTGAQSLAVFSAPEFAFDGDTTGGAQWRRPQTLTTLSSTATSTPLQAITTTVGRTGNYHVLSDQTVGAGGAWDGVLLVYESSFDPAAPLANLIAINDDYAGSLLGGMGAGYSGVENLPLVAGRNYIIVTTGFDNNEAGEYHVEIRRPAQSLLLDTGDLSHWRSGTFSRGQEAAMDPGLTIGTRKLLTPLDFAGLADLGWEIGGPRWPGAGATITLDLATGDGGAIRATSAGHPGLHRLAPAAGGFIEVVADASAPVLMRLWDSAGRLVATSEATSRDASLIAHAAAAETYTLEVAADAAATYELRFATTPAGHRLYFPEGFATWQTDEIVWLTNTGPASVSFTLTMRYEDPSLPRAQNILASGESIEPGEQVRLSISSRGGTFATDAVSGETILTDTPYALVLEATGHLAATVERSDVFGGQRISTAEEFTTSVERTWTFARAQKDPADVHDFLVFYNPNDHDAVVTIRFFTGSVQMEVEQILGPNRRGGLNLNLENDAPAGLSGVVITSAPLLILHEGAHRGLVAALSHFDAAGSEGWLVTGHAGALPAAGVLAAGSPGTSAELLIFNPGSGAAVLEVDDGTSVVATINIAPLAAFAQPAPMAAGLRYRFTSGAGAVQLVERMPGEAASAGPATVAARNHFSGVADLARGGLRESLGAGAVVVFNPGSEVAEVRFRFVLRAGGEATATLNVAAGGFATLLLRDVPELLATVDAFSVVLRSTAPIAAAMSVFDGIGMIGWASSPMPAGVVGPVG
jgi:hypothetical protein